MATDYFSYLQQKLSDVPMKHKGQAPFQEPAHQNSHTFPALSTYSIPFVDNTLPANRSSNMVA